MTNLLIQDAEEEIKRADHLLYISLKYTRTRDIVKNIIVRLIAAFDLAIMAILEDANSKKKLYNVSDNWNDNNIFNIHLKFLFYIHGNITDA